MIHLALMIIAVPIVVCFSILVVTGVIAVILSPITVIATIVEEGWEEWKGFLIVIALYGVYGLTR